MKLNLTVQVPHTAEIDEQAERLAAKLDRLLWMYQPELVRLHGRLVHHTEREGTICTLDLHLPTGQLCAQATASHAQAALGTAGDELLEQVNKQRRRMLEMRRRPSRAPRGPATPEAIESGAPSEGFSLHLPELEAFVQRRLRWHESFGDIPALEVHEVLDEVVVEALTDMPAAGTDPQRWFLVLAERAIRRLAKQQNGQATDSEAEAAPSVEDELPGDGADPEQISMTAEMITQLTEAARSLPAQQRNDLLLWMLEGFTVRELALLSRRPRRQVEASLATARKEIAAQVDLPPGLRSQLA